MIMRGKELDVEEYVIVETLDGKTCDLCASLDGKVYPMSEYQIGVTAPPFHPWCRGTTAPYFADMEGIGERWARDAKTGKAYEVPKDMTYRQWKQKYVDNAEKSGIINPSNNPWGFNEIQSSHSVSDDIGTLGNPICNPKYSTGQWGYTQNCQRCVPAYEFRRRGYDVIAVERPKTNNQIIWGTECFTDANGQAVGFTHFCSARKVQEELNNAPDGSRYSIFVQWTSKASHVFVAEKENGVVRYVDPQSGKTDVADYFQKGLKNRFGFFRMDDKLITSDDNLVKKAVESAKNA